ncbi:replication restart helicase PriA [Candidatus Ichthyocystis hellenicum]|uniref:replication restart helicase PriA n=1 Tax=Candidatus Ichthyocystis hellenicum TaxID=1561003 RepID=UPI0015846015|nr:primosomal protein N' [Candidatus Ichthyocystis hellenicum]
MSFFIRVVVDVHSRNQFFDYRVPDDHAVTLYQWIYVPFRKKIILALVIAVDVNPEIPAAKCLCIDGVVPLPPMPKDWYDLIEFAARYYFYPIGPAILKTIPVDFKQKKNIFSLICYRLTNEGKSFCNDTPPHTSLAAQVCHVIGYSKGHCSLSRVAHLSPRIGRTLVTLLKKNLIEFYEHNVVAVEKSSVPDLSGPPILLSDEQKIIVDKCNSLSEGFYVHLLYGVTGSGKTNTYLQLVRNFLLRRQQVLILVPEIGLINQTCENIARYFPGVAVVCCSSATTNKIKAQDWLSTFTGDANILVGTRSAIFFPLPFLGLIVVDEEHDPAYKQDDHLRYHARDLAIWYAKRKGIPIVLSSATPSLETLRHVKAGRYLCHKLLCRPDNKLMPDISLIDIRDKSLSAGISADILMSVGDALSRSEQSLIFINRRGFSPTLRCLSCRWECMCPYCSVRLVFHKADKKLICHHCSFVQPVFNECPDCGNVDLSLWGVGTQRVEEVLREHFPEQEIARIDRDVMNNPQSFCKVLKRIHNREVSIIVGTQMMAKGHHFEHLSNVGVIDADYLLFSPILRAPERLFSLLLQVAGRSGRGCTPGKVMIQTSHPDSPLYKKLMLHDYWSFAQELLQQRSDCNLPPFCYQAFLCVRHKDESKVWNSINWCRDIAVKSNPENVIIYDSSPMLPFKVARYYRARLLVESVSRSNLHSFINYWYHQVVEQLPKDVMWYFNIDPMEI